MNYLKKVPVILVKLMRFNAILWFASTADRNNACARTGWPLATHYIQKHILFSCFRLHSKFVSHFFTFSRFIFAFYARCIETDIGKVINVQTNVVVICFVLLVCFLWGGFLSIFSMRFFVPFAINSFLQLIKALTLRFMIQGACIDESGRERGWESWNWTQIFLPVYTKISFLIAPKIPVWSGQSDQMAWSRAFSRWYNYWCYLNGVVGKLAFDWNFDWQIGMSHFGRVCWVNVAFWTLHLSAGI